MAQPRLPPDAAGVTARARAAQRKKPCFPGRARRLPTGGGRGRGLPAAGRGREPRECPRPAALPPPAPAILGGARRPAFLLPVADLLLPLGILTLAGFTQGLTGFGFGLVSMALLPLLLPVREAAAVVAALNLVTCAVTLWGVRDHLCWRRGRSLTLGSAAGVPFGVYLLAALDPAPLLRLLGGLLVVFAVAELTSGRRTPAPLPGWLGWPAGFLGGSIGGAFNMGGPPVAS